MDNFADVVDFFIGLINAIIPLIFALTLLVIVWKVVDAWVIGAADQAKVEEGKKTVFIGIIVLVIMSGIWGILQVLRNSLF